MTEQLHNFGSSTLQSGITADDVQLTLVTNGGDSFSDEGDFRIRIEDELILCSLRSGDIITLDERGAEDTTAAPHAAGEVVEQVITERGLLTVIEENTAEGNTGPEGPRGREHIIFTQEGEAQLSTGSKPYALGYAADILLAVPFCETPPTEDPITFDVLVNNVPITSGLQIDVDSYTGTAVVPDDDPYEADAGDLITVDITGVGQPSEGGDVVIDVRDVSAGVTSSTTTKSQFNIPIPASFQPGDLLLCFCVTLSQTISLFADGWEELLPTLEDTSHLGSFHLYTIAKIAEVSESASQACVFTGGTPMQAVTLSIKNPQVLGAQPDDEDQLILGTSSGTGTLPAIDSSQDNELGVWVYANRYADEATDTIDLDAELTTDYQGATIRSTATTPEGVAWTNVGLAVGHKLYPTADTTAAYVASTAGITLPRWLGRDIMLFQGNAGGTPGTGASVDVIFQERT